MDKRQERKERKEAARAAAREAAIGVAPAAQAAPQPAAPRARRNPRRVQPAKPSPPSLTFVDTPALMRDAFDSLRACNVFGFATEPYARHFPIAASLRAEERAPVVLQIAGMVVANARAYRPPNLPPRGDGTAAADAVVYVFDLRKLLPEYGAEFSEALGGLLESPRALFVGANIARDFLLLARMYGAVMPCFVAPVRGVVDVGFLRGDEQRIGLKRAASKIAGVLLDDAPAPNSWARNPLREVQVVYAANMARVALMVFFAAGVGAFKEVDDEVCVAGVEVWSCRRCDATSATFEDRECLAGCGGKAGTERAGFQDGGMEGMTWALVTLPCFADEVKKLERAARAKAAKKRVQTELKAEKKKAVVAKVAKEKDDRVKRSKRRNMGETEGTDRRKMDVDKEKQKAAALREKSRKEKERKQAIKQRKRALALATAGE